MMKSELVKCGWMIKSHSIDHVETIDLYDSLITKSKMGRFKHEGDKVKFPIYSPIDCWKHFESIKTINLQHGATFISDRSLTPTLILEVIGLFAAFITFGKKKYVDFEDTLFFSLPINIIDFAFGSRIDSGFRLLERTLRHSFDNKTGDFRKSTFKLVQVKESGEYGFFIRFNVPASMKKNIYTVECIVTANNLYMSKCTCKAGGHDHERIVCVHTLVLPYLLTLLLTSGYLAEHILIELSNRWQRNWERRMSTKDINVVKKMWLLLCRHQEIMK